MIETSLIIIKYNEIVLNKGREQKKERGRIRNSPNICKSSLNIGIQFFSTRYIDWILKNTFSFHRIFLWETMNMVILLK